MIKDKKMFGNVTYPLDGVLTKIGNDEFNFVVDTTGENGNAYWLLAFADRLCGIVHMESQKDKIIEEMKSGDYENLLLTFDKYFGGWVCLIVNLKNHKSISRELKLNELI